MGLREIKMERTRQLIADKAFELFTEHGFDHTTVEQIAAAAEVGPRTLYRYYPTKETLLVKYVEVHLFASLNRLREQPDDVGLPQALYAMMDSVITTTVASGDRVLAVFDLAERTPSVRAQLSDLWATWRRAVTAEVVRRYSGGRSPELTANLAASCAMIVIDVAVRGWVDSGGKTSMRRLVNRSLDLMRSGEVPIAGPAGR
ncbi:MAG: TetR family transcriptional regulator [Kibdelosporangium sp.]